MFLHEAPFRRLRHKFIHVHASLLQIDMGQLVNLLSISQSNQTEFEKTISRAEDLRLHWSIDGVNFYTATLRLNKHYNGVGRKNARYFYIQSNLDISKLMGHLFTGSNELICTSGNLDL